MGKNRLLIIAVIFIEAAYSFESPDGGDNIHVFNVTFGLTSPVTII